MKIHKIDGELYVEWTTITAAIIEIVKMVGFAVFGIVSFYALWVLLELVG